MSKSKKINTEIIENLSKRDYEKFKENEASYLLYSWVKDELILCKLFKYDSLEIEAKALSRIINILASLREKNLLIKSNIQIDDTKNIKIIFDVDFTQLNNSERRRMNETYKNLGVNFEEVEEEKLDETYEHMF